MQSRLHQKVNDMESVREQRENELRKYLNLRLNDMKLKAVDGLSTGVSSVLSIIAAVMLGAIVLATFAFGTVILLGESIGSWAAASFIVGGILILLLIVMLLLWKRFFINIFVRLFISIFYGNE